MRSLYKVGRFLAPELMRVAMVRSVWKCIDAQPEPLRNAIIELLNEIKIARASRDSTRYFKAVQGKRGLKLHLGCGTDIRDGWVNVDLSLNRLHAKPLPAYNDTLLINHDLRLGLPLEDESCKFIYSSHFLEHLQYQQGLRLLRDCYRALQSGGVFRVALPNIKGVFEAYLREDYDYFTLIDSLRLITNVDPNTKTLVDYVNYAIYQHGEHKYIYDEDKVILILKKMGYRSVSVSTYRDGIDRDIPVRRRHSFYIEAIK
jgi:hypothetical protein